MGCILCQQNFRFGDGGAFEFEACPDCGAEPGQRTLAWFFQRFVRLPEGAKVLEIGPSTSQARHFPRILGAAKYTAIDTGARSHQGLLKPPHRFLRMDPTRMSFSEQCFDVILCNHILPFVKSDYQAMSQMHRCLKAAGFAVANVTIELPKTRRSSEMHEENPERYSREYLQENGTAWVYGEDYFERLEAAGFFWHRLRLRPLAGPSLARSQALCEDDELFLCFKFRDTMESFLSRIADAAGS